MSFSNVTLLISGIALFLFGMNYMGTGLKRAAGSKMELFLYKLSSTPIKGVLLGTGVTAAIQSSSATSVMVVGFVNSGMMKFKQAIGVIIGATLGTSITGWVVCLSTIEGASGWSEVLSTSTLTCILSLVGVIIIMFDNKTTHKHIASIMIGFSVLMFGLKSITGSVEPLKDSEFFTNLLVTFSNPLVGILAGTVFTGILQSASAAVGILQALSVTGVIDVSIAFPVLLGIGIGSAVPVLLSAIGSTADGKKSAFSFLWVNLLGSVIIGGIFYILNGIIHFDFLDKTLDVFTIAIFNTAIRLVNVIILSPFIGAIEKTLNKMFKDKDEDTEELLEIDRLEDRFIQYPSIAVEQCRNTINTMTSIVLKNLSSSLDLLCEFDEKKYKKIDDRENIIDRYEDKLGVYIVKVTEKELSTDENKEISRFLHALNDLERIGDHACNIAETAKEIKSKNIRLSDNAVKEISILINAVKEIVENTFTSFVERDISLAEKTEPLEEWIDVLCDTIKMNHVNRLQNGTCTLLHGFVFSDLLTNFERVSDHCSNIAVATIELETDNLNSHKYLNEIKSKKDGHFIKIYEEYENKYAL